MGKQITFKNKESIIKLKKAVRKNKRKKRKKHVAKGGENNTGHTTFASIHGDSTDNNYRIKQILDPHTSFHDMQNIKNANEKRIGAVRRAEAARAERAERAERTERELTL